MTKSYIGIDIGGTKMEGILWKNGKILQSKTQATPKNRQKFLAAVFGLIRGVMGVGGVKGIGLAVAGAQDQKRGIILNSPNLKFLNNLALRTISHYRIRLPVLMDNDTNCFLRAEARFGLARGIKNVVALTLGTGVGGAVLVHGRLLQGRHGAAGELGHMVIAYPHSFSPFSPRERGRLRGGLTLEDLVSSHGFLRLGVRDPLDCQNKAFAGDKKAIAVYNQIGRYLGVGLASLVNIFDPELIVLGGGISRARSLLTKPAIKEMRRHTLLPAAKLPPVRISKLKHAGALGAVALFLK